LKALAEAAYHVVAPDRRGYGQEFEGIGLLKFLGGIAGEDRAAGESSVSKGSS
jgi:pimeloyl-ACP methyl ester carboxylesterase